MDDRLHLGKCIMDTAHMIKLGLNSVFWEAELTGMQARVLGFITKANENGESIYQKNIETEFKISRASVTSLLNTLEKNGYVQRQRVPGDARLKKIVLTQKTKEKEAKNHIMLQNFEMHLADGLSEEEIVLLVELLNKVSGNIDNLNFEELRGVKR